MLPPLRVRQYSISSTPLHKPGHCTISYGVIDRIALSSTTDHEQRFQGVTGSYLATLKAGDLLQIGVRATAKKTFRLPADTEATPLIMFAAGTGLAPFRGFIQERALQAASNPGRKLAPAVLFLGCRSQTNDRLYAEELDEWEAQGVVKIRYAFSRESEASKGCKYVHERMAAEDAELVTLWRSGARAYVCGTREFAKGVAEAARKIATKARDGMSLDQEAQKLLEERFNEQIQARVASDVFD